MINAGCSTRRVAGQVDRSEYAVRNCWEQWTREGTHTRKTGSGATRKTTWREDRRIVRQALVDPTVTHSTIRAGVGVSIIPQTRSRHFAEANLKSKRLFRALPLTPEHRQLRLQWCQAKSMCNVTDWQKVVFSDESRFVLGTDDNRVRVWRRPGAISQQDNARSHKAKVAEELLRHFQTISWPPRFPDLSPVEHARNQLKRQIPSCHSVRDLELVVQDLLSQIKPGTFNGVESSIQASLIAKLQTKPPTPVHFCHNVDARSYHDQTMCHTPGLALHTTVAGKCRSSPEDKQEREGTGKERLYPLLKSHTTQVTASKARQGRLMSPGSLTTPKEEFLGVPLTPPKRVTRFPRLEEGNVPINTSGYGMFLGISRVLGGVMDREKISLRADSRPIRKADCVSKKNPLQNTEVNRREI
ncbi:transposable element Tc1 transposase [Trichonephila clavipes]|nr:transposable element Tc1 transposase [Trichonephila clavipes]